MSIAFVGIDPGQKGGVAILWDSASSGDASASRYPGDYVLAAEVLDELLPPDDSHACAFACIEKVSSMPKQGVASSFKFGANYGAWLGILAAYRISHRLVTPRQWQKEMLDAGTGETKERSLQMARRLFPHIDMRYKADDGKADALHLARYAKMLYEKGEFA